MNEKTITLETAEIDFLTNAILTVNKTNLCNDIFLSDREKKMVVALIKKLNAR